MPRSVHSKAEAGRSTDDDVCELGLRPQGLDHGLSHAMTHMFHSIKEQSQENQIIKDSRSKTQVEALKATAEALWEHSPASETFPRRRGWEAFHGILIKHPLHPG